MLGTVTSSTGGSLEIPRAEDYEPFCDGWVFLTERSTNRVVLKNVITGVTAAEWDLPDLPVEMVLDEANQLLFVAMGSGGGLARIDLSTIGAGALDVVSVPGNPQSIALGAGGNVYTTGFYETGGGTIGITNTDGDAPVMTTGPVLFPTPSMFTSGTTQIAYDRTSLTMYISGTDGLASFIVNVGVDFSQIDVDDELFDDLNSEIIAASPDGFSVAIVDQVADLIFDLETGNTQDLTDTFWIVDSTLDMTNIAFDGAGNRLGVATVQELIVFDANGAHDEIVTLQPTSCAPDAAARPGVSRGNDVGFYKTDCGDGTSLTETIYWWEL